MGSFSRVKCLLGISTGWPNYQVGVKLHLDVFFILLLSSPSAYACTLLVCLFDVVIELEGSLLCFVARSSSAVGFTMRL